MVEYCASLVNQVVEVEVDDCTAGEGGCPIAINEDGDPAVIIEFPEEFDPGEVPDFRATRFTIFDTRVDASGLCNGQQLVLFDGDLIIPGYLCASSPFVVIVVDTDLIFSDGTIATEMFPEELFDDASDCDIPIVGDLQAQGVVVWQATDRTQLVEGHAIDVTDGCSSSRGRIRGLSFLMVGLEINFGIDHSSNPEGVEQAFINLTITKLGFLQLALEKANEDGALRFQDYKRLMKMVKNAIKLYNAGDFPNARDKIKNGLKFVEKAEFIAVASLFNHFGNLSARFGNILFMTDVKVIPFAP